MLRDNSRVSGFLNFELRALGCYAAVMSRKGSSESHHGWADFIGLALLATALLLVVAQWSFDQHDIPFNNAPPNQPPHNWIGRLGAHFAWVFFLVFGVTAYLLPVLFAAFGVGYLFNFLGYLREHSRWSLMWAGVLLLSLTGLLHIMEDSGLAGKVRDQIGAHSAGGLLGFLTFEYGFWMLGKIGAIIVYTTLSLIGILFLTNFRLGEWLRSRFDGETVPVEKQKADPQEAALERKARELEKKKKELEQEVATVTRSGLGQDLQPGERDRTGG
jgi:S-DNA-T family DNA segregation ATPase FtsK/SpoIIIE